MKNLFLLLLVVAVLLSGCSLLQSPFNDEKGVVISPLAKVGGEWIMVVEPVETPRDASVNREGLAADQEIDTSLTLVCPRELLKKCGNGEFFDEARYKTDPSVVANKKYLTAISFDKR